MSCERAHEVERYHDAELTLPERSRLEAHFHACADCRQLEAHFHACADCRQRLRELGRLSSLLVTVSGAAPPPNYLPRLQKTSRAAVRDVKTVRFAGWLTAAAAAILIGTLLRPDPGTELTASPDTWEAVAVRAAVEEVSSDSLVMAQWMADDLSATEQR